MLLEVEVWEKAAAISETLPQPRRADRSALSYNLARRYLQLQAPWVAVVGTLGEMDGIAPLIDATALRGTEGHP